MFNTGPLLLFSFEVTDQMLKYWNVSCGPVGRSSHVCEAIWYVCGLSWPGGQVHQIQALVFLISRVWVRVLVLALVSLSKTLNHYYFVLWMGRTVVGLVCCVMLRTHIHLSLREKIFAPVFLAVASECPAVSCKPLLWSINGSQNSSPPVSKS